MEEGKKYPCSVEQDDNIGIDFIPCDRNVSDQEYISLVIRNGMTKASVWLDKETAISFANKLNNKNSLFKF